MNIKTFTEGKRCNVLIWKGSEAVILGIHNSEWASTNN